MGQCVPLQCQYAKTNLHAVIGVSIKARSVSFVSLSLLERDREKLKEGGGWRGGEEHNTSFYAVIIMMSLLATEQVNMMLLPTIRAVFAQNWHILDSYSLQRCKIESTT